MSKYSGNKLEIDVFGSSHSSEIGIEVKGFPIGSDVDTKALQEFCNRRRAVKANYSTSRIEEDLILFKSGIDKDKIVGDVLAVIENKNTRSSDYQKQSFIPRPSHADYVAMKKYGDGYDPRGGGWFSGRMTAPLCIGGGIAKQFLEKQGIKIYAYVSSIGNTFGSSYKNTNLKNMDLSQMDKKFPILNEEDREKFNSEIQQASECGDSIGGTVECVVTGLPIGVGDYMFDCLESQIAKMIFAVPAVKGIEFGSGFDLAKMRGSSGNDEMQYDENGDVEFLSNHNGGILGGISSGEMLTMRIAIKPTPSIAMAQKSIDVVSKQNVILEIKGRHDSCIVPRATCPIEAVVALSLYDIL